MLLCSQLLPLSQETIDLSFVIIVLTFLDIHLNALTQSLSSFLFTLLPLFLFFFSVTDPAQLAHTRQVLYHIPSPEFFDRCYYTAQDGLELGIPSLCFRMLRLQGCVTMPH